MSRRSPCALRPLRSPAWRTWCVSRLTSLPGKTTVGEKEGESEDRTNETQKKHSHLWQRFVHRRRDDLFIDGVCFVIADVLEELQLLLANLIIGNGPHLMKEVEG